MKRLSLFALFLVFACSVMAQVNRARAEFFFEQGDGNLNPALADNGRQLTVLDSIAVDFEKVGIQDRYVILHSYVAPDGSYESNEDLARRRADVIEKTFDSQLKTDAHVIYKPHYYEWGEIEKMARVDDLLPNKDEVLRIFGGEEEMLSIDNATASDELIQKIKGIDNGETYSYVVQHYFPKLNRVVLEVRYMGNYPLPRTERRVISERVYYRDMATGELVNEQQTKAQPLQPETPIIKDSVKVEQPTQRVEPVVSMEPKGSFWEQFASRTALKTNLLYDLVLVPNLAVEFAVTDRISVSADWMYAWWSRDSKHDYWRVYGGDLEVKYWFGNKNGQRFTGHHLGVYGGILTYDVEFGNKGYLGDKWSYLFGLSYGYAMPLSRRLRLDFELGLGYMGGEYDEYIPEGDQYFWQQTKKRKWFGPTRAEVTLIWLLGKNSK